MKRIILLIFLLVVTLELSSQSVLTIEECRKLALEHNNSLLISQEKIKIASELKKAVFTQFLPNFSATGTYLWNEKNISLLSEDALLPIGSMMADGSFGFRQDQVKNQWVQVSPGVYAPLDANGKPFDPKVEPGKIIWKDYALLPKEAMEIDVKNVFAGGIGFTQPIFLGGKIRELYKISKYNEQLAQVQNKEEVTNLLIEVDEAYWRVVSLENKVKLAKEYCNLLNKLDKNVGIMIEEGVATKGDALKVKVKLNEAEIMFTKADNGLRLSRMALNQLCGIELGSVYELADDNLNVKSAQIGMPDIASALGKRPEIESLTLLENSAKSNIKIMESRFMPNVVLTGNYLVSNPNFYNGISNSFSGMFSVGVALNIPLFHFGDRIHTLKAAKGQYKIVQYKMEDAKEKIELQITQSNFKMTESVRKNSMCEKNIEKASENLKFAGEAFEAGLVGSTELMEAQTAWLSAFSEKIDSSIEVKLCELYLKKALGLSVNN